jgi:hypothetical protein
LGRKLEQLNLTLPSEALPALLEEVRHFASARKSTITDEELETLVANFKKTHGMSSQGLG